MVRVSFRATNYGGMVILTTHFDDPQMVMQFTQTVDERVIN